MTQDDTGIIDRGEGCVKNCGFYLKINEKSLKSFSQKKDIQFEVLKKIAEEESRWQRNRTGRPLSLLQIHVKNNRKVNKVYKTTSDH